MHLAGRVNPFHATGLFLYPLKISKPEVARNYYSYFARDHSRKYNFSKNKLQCWSNPIGFPWNNTFISVLELLIMFQLLKNITNLVTNTSNTLFTNY